MHQRLLAVARGKQGELASLWVGRWAASRSGASLAWRHCEQGACGVQGVGTPHVENQE